MTMHVFFAEGIAARRLDLDAAPDLAALRDRLVARAAPVLDRMPPVPDVKALLSRDGGSCPDDGTALAFDPWSPDRHRCPRCGQAFTGERHHAHWARAQHLWLAERAAHLATIHAVEGDPRAAARARELLRAYFDRYSALPNRDNVLGPTHLFFSTYLESIWILHYLSAAQLLRESGALQDAEIAGINAIAEEAAQLIGEFNEGMSNRQTWHAAARTALGVWFDDDDLIRDAIEARYGLLEHLTDGFGKDGMWFEGENYHLFALRGLMLGLQWAGTAGADLLDEPMLSGQLAAALMAPTLSALPDFTFPARKDSRYGVSLAHPAYLECWEAGYAWLGERRPERLGDWLQALYQQPSRRELTYDAYLSEAGETVPAHRSRSDLSWWSLWTLAPTLPAAEHPWQGASALLPQQGLALLRRADDYLALECLGGGTGHGHPDRLHLTLFAGGHHWLPDPGTGSYVTDDLFWYRSTLAHNAPRLGATDQPLDESAHCRAWDSGGEWQWMVGEWNGVRRSVVMGPRWILDAVEVEAATPQLLDLPWHLNGTITVETPGTWSDESLDEPFVSSASRFDTDATTVRLRADHEGRTLHLLSFGDGTLWRAVAPGLPGSDAPATFAFFRATGTRLRRITVLDHSGAVSDLAGQGDQVTVTDQGEPVAIHLTATEARIMAGGKVVTLGGVLPATRPLGTLFAEKPSRAKGAAIWVEPPPKLDGSLEGFVTAAPLRLEGEHHYYRSEEPYPGPKEFAARAWVNWDDAHLHVAVEVAKGELVLRSPDAPPLLLDNESDDIHSDGVQVYYRVGEQALQAYLVRPWEGGRLLSRPIGDTPDMPIAGAWQRTARGYRLTMALPCHGLLAMREQQQVAFDILVNEMRPGRVRRAGQLSWSSGNGWVYLRGDRHAMGALGVLELMG